MVKSKEFKKKKKGQVTLMSMEALISEYSSTMLVSIKTELLVKQKRHI